MNFLDLIIILPLIYAAYKGFKHGFIIELFTLLAIIVGIYVGIHFSDYTANWLKNSFGWTSEYTPVVSFTITFLAVGALIYFGGKTIEKMVKIAQLSSINKMLGVVFALVKTVYILSIFFVLIESYDEKSSFFPTETKENSLLYKPVLNTSMQSIPSLKESTIFLRNALKPESDSTGLTIEQVLAAKKTADSLGIDASDAKTIFEVHQKYNQKHAN